MSFKQNKAQEEAIKTIDGRVMIVSCPGSGKTTTLIRRIHHMIESGVSPNAILMVTFSKAAALEMKDKYEKFFGKNPGIAFQTIHSLCLNLLLKEGRCQRGDVLQESDKLDYLVSVIKQYPEGDPFEAAKNAATNITSVKNNYVDVAKYEPDGIDGDMFRDVYYQYEKWKKAVRKIDFDDMLLLCKDMFDNDKQILSKWANRFRYIQCDEYQDTNMIQRDILYALSEKHGNLCVVGDDDQSIYRFRGARPEIMLHFMDDFPNAKKIMMGTNYRSAEEIVKKAGKLILKNKVRYGKTFISQRGLDGVKGHTEYFRCETKQEEMEWMVKKIKELNEEGIAYKDMAILFRTNGQAILPLTTLSNEEIPFYCVESVRSIYDGWIFKDIRNYIELACGEYADDADMHKKILSVLNKPERFLNPDEFMKVDFSSSGFHKAIYPLAKDAYWKYEQALENVDNWLRLLGPGKLSMDDPADIAFERLQGARAVRYDKHIESMAKLRHIDSDDYFDERDELRKDAAQYATIREWFQHADWTSKFIKEETQKKNTDGVTLATMHKSKGLEWKVVFIIDCNDGIIPHKNNIDTDLEEERRLFYVAMTRAKDSLYVINSNRTESRFIKEAGLMTEEQKKAKEEIPKYLPGKKVIHKTFGEGKLLSYGPNTITVAFKSGAKMFKFPDSFKDGFLTYG